MKTEGVSSEQKSVSSNRSKKLTRMGNDLEKPMRTGRGVKRLSILKVLRESIETGENNGFVILIFTI